MSSSPKVQPQHLKSLEILGEIRDMADAIEKEFSLQRQYREHLARSLTGEMREELTPEKREQLIERIRDAYEVEKSIMRILEILHDVKLYARDESVYLGFRL